MGLRRMTVSGKIRFYGYRADFMPQFLTLRGRNALSGFRSSKLNAALQQARLKLSALSAEYWHFVSVSRALTAKESAILEPY